MRRSILAFLFLCLPSVISVYTASAQTNFGMGSIYMPGYGTAWFDWWNLSAQSQPQRFGPSFSEILEYSRLLNDQYYRDMIERENAELRREQENLTSQLLYLLINQQQESASPDGGVIPATQREPLPHENLPYLSRDGSPIFHAGSCVLISEVSPFNYMIYTTREKALQAGLRRCKICNP